MWCSDLQRIEREISEVYKLVHESKQNINYLCLQCSLCHLLFYVFKCS